MVDGDSYKKKALALFKSKLGKKVKSSELASITGKKGGPISHNIRRIFELRDEDGYDIVNWKDNKKTGLNLRVDEWVLLSLKPNPANIRTRKYTKKTWLEVMVRDNYQCQICGRTKDDDDPFKPSHKVTLHLGHKKAFKGLRNASAVIAISTRERHGKLKLLRTITYLIKKRPIIIGVVGYPNTGKSSVINYLAGRKKARTSPEAGFTKGKQWINLSRNIRLIDTPGVIPSKEKSKMELALKSAVTRVEDAEETAAEIIRIIIRKRKFNTLKKRYGIKESINPSIILEMIAKSKNKLKKKGELDLDGAAKMVIHDWQKGKLK